MELSRQGCIRTYLIPGVGEVNQIKFYHSGKVLHTSRAGWLEHHEIHDGIPSNSGHDVLRIACEGDLKRANKLNLARNDNFYISAGTDFTGRVRIYDVYIYGEPSAPMRFETGRTETTISYSTFVTLPVQGDVQILNGTVRPADMLVDGILVRTLCEYESTEYGKHLEDLQNQMKDAGLELSTADCERLEKWFDIKPKSLNERRRLVADKIYNQTQPTDIDGKAIWRAEETDWSHVRTHNPDIWDRSYQAEEIDTGLRHGYVFAVKFEAGTVVVKDIWDRGVWLKGT